MSDDAIKPDAQPQPEPLVSAEAIRAVVIAAAAGVWAVPIPDPVLDIVVPSIVSVLGVGVSWALTMLARGKVYALRRGVDVDAVVDEVQRRVRATQ